jgi:hypothetical protein
MSDWLLVVGFGSVPNSRQRHSSHRPYLAGIKNNVNNVSLFKHEPEQGGIQGAKTVFWLIAHDGTRFVDGFYRPEA